MLAGSLTTLSPCVFPVLPLVVGGAVQWTRLMPVAMGVGMAQGIDGEHVRTFGGWRLLTGIAILGGANKWLEARIVEHLPDSWVRLTTLF